MMWQFIRDALSTGRYGESLHMVSQDLNSCVFAVKAENQKKFLNNKQLDQAWNLFLEYSQRKLGPRFEKPHTPTAYTKLRAKFLNALVKCSCSGTITKLGKKELYKLNLTNIDFKYFQYIGNKPPMMKNNYEMTKPKTSDGQLETFKLQNFDDQLETLKLQTSDNIEQVAFEHEPELLELPEVVQQDTNVTSDQINVQLKKSQSVQMKREPQNYTVEMDSVQNSISGEMNNELQNVKPGEMLICVSNDDGGLKLLKNLGPIHNPMSFLVGLQDNHEENLIWRPYLQTLQSNCFEEDESSFFLPGVEEKAQPASDAMINFTSMDFDDPPMGCMDDPTLDEFFQLGDIQPIDPEDT